MVAAAGAILFPSLAGAHHNDVTGVSACADASGTYTVTWQIKNSEASTAETATLTFTGGGSLSASVIQIPKGGTGQVTQSGIPGSATTATLTAAGVWTNQQTNTSFGSVALSGTCAITATPAEPTIAQTSCTGPGQTKDAQYTIPTTTGVNYLVGGSVVPAGQYDLTPGASVTITAQAKPGYTVAGSPSWTLAANVVDCVDKITVPPAVFTNEKCVDRFSVAGTLVLAPTTGITYSVSPASAIIELSSSSTGSAALPAGAYTVRPGSAVTITATAATGYAIEGTSVFTHTYPAALDCTDHVTPVAPVLSQTECTAPGQAKGASYTVVATAGVRYFVSGSATPAEAGTYPLAQGATVSVRAEAIAGYTTDGTSEWAFTATTLDCTLTATPAAPAYTVQQCIYPTYTVQPATVTIPATTGVVYSLDGAVVPAGVITVGVGAHAVTATAAAGYDLTDYPAGGWAATITAVPCAVSVLAEPPAPTAVPTLASTGADADTLALLGLLVLAAGGALVVLTARRGDSQA